MVVAIDGPGGVGKSTVAGVVASRLGAPHLDTGAFYRAATLAVVRAGADPGDPSQVVPIVSGAEIGYESGTVTLDDEDVTSAVREPEVTAAVSAVSAIPGVREMMVQKQRAWVEGHGGSAVVEGRDIGTVVFPDAALKAYLTADARVRAERRAGDPEAGEIDVDTLTRRLEDRDRADSSREASPLHPADDAVTIDTTTLTADQVATIIVGLLP